MHWLLPGQSNVLERWLKDIDTRVEELVVILLITLVLVAHDLRLEQRFRLHQLG